MAGQIGKAQLVGDLRYTVTGIEKQLEKLYVRSGGWQTR